MRNKILCLLLPAIMLFNKSLYSQDDLLKMIGGDNEGKERVKYAFKSPRVINSHSIEFLNPGTMDFRILHRFGEVNEGYKNFFGLDQASMRMGLDFGILHNLMVGIGRSTYRKEVDGFIKYAPVRQTIGEKAMPITVALVAGMMIDGSPWSDPFRKNYYTSRLAYSFQLLVGRKFNESFSLQLMPTMIHKNLVALDAIPNDIYGLGIGGRLKLSKRIAFTWDYTHVIRPALDSGYYHPLSIGFDIETGGHVFQLHFSNSTGMNERAFITETRGSWAKGDIRFGFNLSRVFQIRKKKGI